MAFASLTPQSPLTSMATDEVLPHKEKMHSILCIVEWLHIIITQSDMLSPDLFGVPLIAYMLIFPYL